VGVLALGQVACFVAQPVVLVAWLCARRMRRGGSRLTSPAAEDDSINQQAVSIRRAEASASTAAPLLLVPAQDASAIQAHTRPSSVAAVDIHSAKVPPVANPLRR
jgi:hypothetical protein